MPAAICGRQALVVRVILATKILHAFVNGFDARVHHAQRQAWLQWRQKDGEAEAEEQRFSKNRHCWRGGGQAPY